MAILAGSSESGKLDGLGVESSFLQPTGICSEGKTLIVIDSGNKCLRILTSLKALCKYLGIIQNYTKFSQYILKYLERGQSMI